MMSIPLDWVSASINRDPTRSVSARTIGTTGSDNPPLINQRHQALAIKAALEFQPLLEPSSRATPIPPVQTQALPPRLNPLATNTGHSEPSSRASAPVRLETAWIDNDALRLNMTQALDYYRKKAQQLA